MASAPSRAALQAPRSPESYESLHRRNAAAEILQSYERLSWYSFQRCESISQTRLHFQNVIAGLSEEDELALVDWPEDRTARPKVGDDTQAGRRGNERVSTGSGAGGRDGVAGSSAQKSGKGREHNEGSASAAGQQGKRKKKRASAG